VQKKVDMLPAALRDALACVKGSHPFQGALDLQAKVKKIVVPLIDACKRLATGGCSPETRGLVACIVICLYEPEQHTVRYACAAVHASAALVLVQMSHTSTALVLLKCVRHLQQISTLLPCMLHAYAAAL
jgi:hypothetical protein